MAKMIFYTILAVLLAGWAIGNFYLHVDGYIHSLLVMAGLFAWFGYVYQLKPVAQAD
ncbi:MAG: hypothetical protein JNL72_08525 [Flavipsychrobacter sp.]|nr:hypothetical protein [Flavipsychrobacter sp.]